MEEDAARTIKRLLVTELFVDIPEDEIGGDDGLQSVIGLDSIGFIELRVLCERHFNVQITDGDFTPDNFRTVNRVADLVGRLRAQAVES